MVTQRQSRNLDILRAFAVLSVFAGHGIMTVLTHANFLVASAARFGVMAFFVHTSFVLMLSLERLEREGGNVTLQFYIRRLFRIYPLSIVTVLLVAAFHIPQVPWKSVIAPTGRVVLSNLLLVQNLAHTHDILAPLWSLPFEVQMYLVLPFIYIAVKRWNVDPLMLCGLFALASLPFVPQYLTGIIAYFPCFLAGVIAYKASKHTSGRFSITLFVILLAVVCAVYAVSRNYLQFQKPGWSYAQSVADWLCSLSIGLALPHIREIQHGWVSRAAHQIAKYSYGIYLSHVIVMWFAWTKMAGSPLVLRILFFVVAVVGIPILAFHLIENPGINLGKRLARRLQNRRQPAPLARPA